MVGKGVIFYCVVPGVRAVACSCHPISPALVGFASVLGACTLERSSPHLRLGEENNAQLTVHGIRYTIHSTPYSYKTMITSTS